MEKTFNAAEAEARIYAAWEKTGAFKAGANRKKDEHFSVMLPPPNVTGFLHAGHAFNHTLQDVMVRWHRMRGFDTLWQPGTDHAGIATQLVVERKLAEAGEPDRRDLGREKFLEKIWDWRTESGDMILEQDKRLGCSMDWSRNAFTMSGAPGDPTPDSSKGTNFHDAVIRVFVDMYNKGLIYRGKRLVNWDPHFETAISDLEVENIEVNGHMWHFKYLLADGATYTYVEKDEDGNVTIEEDRNYISIATTRPETMLGDGAVAVHHDDDRYASLIGKFCEIPVGPKEHRRLVPIIADEYPDPDFGSGAVKITGAHDFNDYQVAKRNGIPLYSLMDTKGSMRSDGLSYEDSAIKAAQIAKGESVGDVAEINLVPEAYRGLDRSEARAKIIDEINAEGLCVFETFTATDEDGNEFQDTRPYVEAKKIMQPFGDRSKVVIEPMLTDQWFVDAEKIVGPALDAVKSGKVKIMPESGEKTYYHWLENIEPWCISRQLWWGHQIPVWYDADGTPYCAATEAEAQELAGGKSLSRDPDVLDTWFSSGLWPIGTLGWPEDTDALKRYFPTSTLITGSDILFFWVARMIMMQIAVVDEVPFDTVYLHGLVCDSKGKKMSKTTGNVIDPLDIVDEFGADALRFTNTAIASLGGALKLDTNRITGYRNFTTKLWNACRFADMNGAFKAASRPTPSNAVNKWIIGETARVREDVDAALKAYRFNDAASALYGFVWGKVCDWYVELSKPLLQGEDSAAKSETQDTMAWVLETSLRMLHPIMPFITEELWGQIHPEGPMLAVSDWPEDLTSDLINPAADREMSWVISLIEGVRSARAQMNVPAGLFVSLVELDADDHAHTAWNANETMIKRLARIESKSQASTAPKGAMTIAAAGATFAMPLADIIDVAKETARIEKNLGKASKEAGALQGRLSNPKFRANASEEVIAEAEANLIARKEEVAQFEAALKRLAEIK